MDENMNGTKKLIKASADLQEETAKAFKVTTRTVRSALAYDTKSPTARLLRAYVLNHGGKLYELKELENPYTDKIVIRN